MTISNEAVESVAKAISDATYDLAWTALPGWVKDQERKDARRLLEAAAPFIRAEALERAAERFDARSQTLFQTMQNMADSREYNAEEITRYGAYAAEANTSAALLRARAVAERGEG